MTEQKVPSFNLWTEPWITLEKPNGGTDCLGIEQTLKRAHEYRAIYEQSPLVVVGIHRLLVAILQFAFAPQENEDLRQLWRAGRFMPNVIDDFGAKYAHRFDLFSVDAPFMQSTDLPIVPGKKDNVSYASRLTYENPSGINVSHYRHGEEKESCFCPVCVARNLVTQPAFATNGGQPFKASINGIPPVYVIPGGETVFESLTSSLVTPNFQPKIRSRETDDAWWVHSPIIGFCNEINDVGYVHSLTFQARRIRVYPETGNTSCSRCGKWTNIFVNKIIFEMGESRPKNAEVWFDPFVAYAKPTKKKPANAIRPNYRRKNWLVWREFANLFLLEKSSGKGVVNDAWRPDVINQLSELDLRRSEPIAFKCVSVLTDNQAKIFSWIESGFEIPPEVLQDEDKGYQIRRALRFTTECVEDTSDIFYKHYRRKKSKQHEVVGRRLEETCWNELEHDFSLYVLEMGRAVKDDAVKEKWARTVIEKIKIAFSLATKLLGDDAIFLALRAESEKELNIRLEIKRKEFLG